MCEVISITATLVNVGIRVCSDDSMSSEWNRLRMWCYRVEAYVKRKYIKTEKTGKTINTTKMGKTSEPI